MNNQTDFLRNKFGPLKARSLKNAIANQITTEFPRIGGPRICSLCADLIMEVVEKHMRSRDHITHGQTLWAAIDINDPPKRHRAPPIPNSSPSCSTSPRPTTCSGASTAYRHPNGCCTELAVCASRLTRKGDYSRTATSQRCSMSAVTTSGRSWPNTSGPPTPSSHGVPRFTMSDRGSLISASFAGCATPAEWTRTRLLARPTTVSKPLIAISANTTVSATAASRALRPRKPLTPSSAACASCGNTSILTICCTKKTDA